MFEIIYEQEDGSIISEISSGPSRDRNTDIFIYENETEFLNHTFAEDLPTDMQYHPRDSFSMINMLKVIPKLRPHIRDGKFEFLIKD